MKRNLLSFLVMFYISISAQAQFSGKPFITKWKTDNSGVSNSDQVIININTNYTYNYDIDWGDGSTETGLTTAPSHTYSSPGTYEIKIYGDFPALFNSNTGTDSPKLVEVSQWGDIEWESMYYMFSDCINMEYTATDVPDMDLVTDMTRMFWYAEKFNADLTGWDVSNVTTMKQIFGQTVIFNGDISTWDVSSVTNMHWAFIYSEAFNQDISGWDVSSVNTMQSMFTGTTAFDQDLGDWDVSSATNLLYMFNGASLSQANYDSILIGWSQNPNLQSGVNFGVNNLTYCEGTEARQKIIDDFGWTFSGDDPSCPFVTTWKTDNSGVSSSNQITLPLKFSSSFTCTIDWGDGTVEEFTEISSKTHTYSSPGTYVVSIWGDFPGINFSISSTDDKLKLVEFNQWGSTQWDDLSYTFAGCSNLEYLADDAPDLSNVTDMSWMFTLSSINADLNDWDVSGVTNMSNMFNNASSFNGDISTWDVSSVTNLSSMFQYATSFDQDLSSWNVGNVTNMSTTFAGAEAFSGDISSWNVSKVTDMSGTFQNTYAFTSDLSAWNVSNVVDMSYMFNSSGFDSDLSGWNVAKVFTMDLMLTNSELSQYNYDLLLDSWSQLTGLKSNVALGANKLTYCAGATARQSLITDFSWTISGDTEYCPLSMSGSSIEENNDVGDLIGSFVFADSDPELTYTYSLVESDVYSDNASFSITDDELKAAVVFDYETKSSYTIFVEVDNGSDTYRSEFDITISDEVFEPITWDGTAWNNGTGPTDTDIVSIEGDFTGEFSCSDLQISSGVTLTLVGDMDLKGDLTNNGTFIVNSGSSLLTYDSNITTGDITIKRNTRYSDGRYSFVGSPMQADASITGAQLGEYVYRYSEAANHDVNGLNRWIDASMTELVPGHGYTQANQQEISFTGQPNTGAVYYIGTNANDGYQLVSNPYAAAIDIDAFIDDNLNITGSVYIWDDNSSDTGRGSSSDYIVANKMGATDSNGPDNDDRWNGHIGSMQGFFVQLIGVATVVNFKQDMRVLGQNADGNFFRTNTSKHAILRINLSSDLGLFKQALLGWDEMIPNDEIVRGWDAPVFNETGSNMVFTTKADQPLTIQTIDSDGDEIPLTFDVQEEGLYTITLDHRESLGHFMYLYDQETEEVIDATQGYEFFTRAGRHDRFKLIKSKRVLGLTDSELLIYTEGKTLFIQPSDQEERTIQVIDLSGRTVLTRVSTGEFKETLSVPAGAYIVTDGTITKKVILK